MSRGRQYNESEGLFSETVLGIFRVIRGFAGLQDLVTISAPYVQNKGIEPEITFHLAADLAFEWTQWLNRSYTHDLRANAWRRRWRIARWCWSTDRASAVKPPWPVW